MANPDQNSGANYQNKHQLPSVRARIDIFQQNARRQANIPPAERVKGYVNPTYIEPYNTTLHYGTDFLHHDPPGQSFGRFDEILDDNSGYGERILAQARTVHDSEHFRDPAEVVDEAQTEQQEDQNVPADDNAHPQEQMPASEPRTSIAQKSHLLEDIPENDRALVADIKGVRKNKDGFPVRADLTRLIPEQIVQGRLHKNSPIRQWKHTDLFTPAEWEYLSPQPRKR